jgi:hypothetical protein
MATMTVAEMVTKVMQEEGYDGFTDGDECGCDGSQPCGLSPMECFGAYRHRFSPAQFDEIYHVEKCAGDDCPVCAKWRSEDKEISP